MQFEYSFDLFLSSVHVFHKTQFSACCQESAICGNVFNRKHIFLIVFFHCTHFENSFDLQIFFLMFTNNCLLAGASLSLGIF